MPAAWLAKLIALFRHGSDAPEPPEPEDLPASPPPPDVGLPAEVAPAPMTLAELGVSLSDLPPLEPRPLVELEPSLPPPMSMVPSPSERVVDDLHQRVTDLEHMPEVLSEGEGEAVRQLWMMVYDPSPRSGASTGPNNTPVEWAYSAIQVAPEIDATTKVLSHATVQDGVTLTEKLLNRREKGNRDVTLPDGIYGNGVQRTMIDDAIAKGEIRPIPNGAMVEVALYTVGEGEEAETWGVCEFNNAVGLECVEEEE